jgi:chaperone required for assembly of F1-ATPase
MSDTPDTETPAAGSPFELGDLAATERSSDPTRTPAAKLELPKRFYTDVATTEGPEGYELRLDGKPVRTPARRLLAVPTAGLAAVLVAEWAAQGERIDPATMPLTRLTNAALDGVAGELEAVRADVAAYAGSDLLCYRPDGPEGLVALTNRLWNPVIDWAERDLGARMVLAEGLMPVAQDPVALARIAEAVPGGPALLVAATHVLTTLTGSALLALALVRGAVDFETAWAAANVDEDWNWSLWGADEEAVARRIARTADARTAALVVADLTAAGDTTAA